MERQKKQKTTIIIVNCFFYTLKDPLSIPATEVEDRTELEDILTKKAEEE